MVEIKRVTYPELTVFARVVRDGFRDVAEQFGITRKSHPLHTSFVGAEHFRWEYRNGFVMFGAYAEKIPVGYASLKEIGDGVWTLDHLAVLPAYRHQGIGRRLIDRCVLELKKCDATKIKIGIIEENTRLKNWYLDYGFCHNGTVKLPHYPFTVGFMALDIQ